MIPHGLLGPARGIGTDRRPRPGRQEPSPAHASGSRQTWSSGWSTRRSVPATPITAGHGVRADRLPAHHRDPFDRILIARAQTEGMTILTRDKRIPSYDVQVMHV
ncbi:type II toxin-antitoxin system VapC family toxin [Streptomyces sp. NPDC048295]|uniref:type II toxin-antitoxin system VapC family toxin n=1 Tax=Streptomyces sp. NPDC048295 TaxID=3154617 RepID=UPI00341DD9A2